MINRKPENRTINNIIDFPNVDTIRRRQAITLAAHMLGDEVPLGSVAFLLKIYALFLDNESVNGRQMADLYGCSTENVRRYISDLTDRGYLERIHYRGWVISEDYLTHFNSM